MNATRPAVAPAGQRVLVADDVPDIAEFVQKVLAREGYETAVAADGEETLQLLDSFRPELVILDIMLPKVHGMDILKDISLRPEADRPGVIVCTAKTFKAEMDQAKELGAFAVLAKPFGRPELIERVRTYFASQFAGGSPSGGGMVSAAYSGKPFLPTIDTSRGYLRLWGTRGSVPVSNPRFARHGGNTSCLEINCGDEIVIIDAGTGIRDLGLELAANPPRTLRLFIGHTHWDHIQGFPFFAPAYTPGFEIHVYGASGFGKDLHSIFRGQLDRDYFPVELTDMQAKIEFHPLGIEPMRVCDAHVSWEFMNHPGATVGFRIETPHTCLAYITDNEFLKGYLGPPGEVELDGPVMAPFRKIVDFVKGVDVLIHEAQYTNEEYLKKTGWGHSSLSNACALVAAAKIPKWIVTHHDPLHDDEFLDRKLMLTRQILRSLGHHAEVVHAHDGLMQAL